MCWFRISSGKLTVMSVYMAFLASRRSRYNFSISFIIYYWLPDNRVTLYSCWNQQQRFVQWAELEQICTTEFELSVERKFWTYAENNWLSRAVLRQAVPYRLIIMWTESSHLYYALVLCAEFKSHIYIYVYLLLHTVSWFLCSVLCTSCIFHHYTNGLFICLSLVCVLRSLQKRARFYEFVLPL